MSAGTTVAPETIHELVLERILDAPREKVFRAWTEPELLKQWFAPKPYTTPVVEIDVRPGGNSRIVMRGPDGNEMEIFGVYLEVIPNRKLVSTDAYSSAWVPAAQPFMTMIITIEDAGAGKTKYTARARHWNEADKKRHEEMGFHTGWGICADQLEALAKSL